MNLIQSLPGFSGPDFNPTVLVQAVNALHAEGGRAALRTLRESADPERGPSRPENILLVARALFVSRDGGQKLPRLSLGSPDITEPVESDSMPSFPLHLQDDLPLLLIGGYRTGGEGLPPQVYLDWCQENAEMRPTALVPSDDPLESVDAFLSSDLWRLLAPERWHYAMLRGQALRAVASAYGAGGAAQRDASLPTAEVDWQEHRRAVRRLSLRWNTESNDYESGRSSDR